MKDAPDILIRLRPLPAEAPWCRRLARVLKALKRCYGFICVSVEEVTDGQPYGVGVGDLAARPASQEAKDGDRPGA